MHTRPDGDAIGSAVGFQRIIELAAGKAERNCSTQLLLLSEAAQNYHFLLPENTWFLDQQITAGPRRTVFRVYGRSVSECGIG